MNLVDRFFQRSPGVGALSSVRKAIRTALRQAAKLPYIEKDDLRAAIDEIAHITCPLQTQADYVAFERALLESGETFTDGQGVAYIRHRKMGISPYEGDYCGLMLRAVLASKLWPRIREHLAKDLAKAEGASSDEDDCVYVDAERGILPDNGTLASNGSVAQVLLAAAKASETANGLTALIEKSVAEAPAYGYRVPRGAARSLLDRARDADKRLRKYARG